MIRLRPSIVGSAIAILFLLCVSGCGGHRPSGIAPFPGRINLNPSGSTSVQTGNVFVFNATAQNAAGGTVNTAFTWASSDSSILNIAPNGLACAGQWDATYTNCTPGNFGSVTVTASALGATSQPTLVFVHPPIDSITVTGVLLNSVPIQEPCLSQGQTMTVEARAFSHGTEITSAVGPFTWTANNAAVAKITPITRNVIFNGFSFDVATNQATATASTPGITQIFANASGASSTSFQQPQYQFQGTTSPVLDFFETCNIQNVTLELGAAGNQQTTQTTFSTTKGTGQNVTAVVTDIMGNTSLPNTVGGIVLSKIPLTWTASQPGDIATGSGCTLSCGLTTPNPGAGSVTASCTPPNCNIGFPIVPASLSGDLTQCTQFFQAQYSHFAGCEQLKPFPVYATTAITGVVAGTPGNASVLATSSGCAGTPPNTCTTSIYSLATSKGSAGSAFVLPTSPNSLLFDVAGDKAFVGSEFGAIELTPANFGSNNSPYTSLGTVNGQVLAVSNNGGLSAYSDTIHTPNSVYIVNSGNANSLSAINFNISEAVGAGFSPDGFKAFILGDSGRSLYIYSGLTSLVGPGSGGPGTNPQLSLVEPANTVAFSPNGAFAFVAEGYATGGAANLTAFSVCDNSLANSISLTGPPLFMQVLPNFHLDGTDTTGMPFPDGIHILILESTGFDIITASTNVPSGGALCPQILNFLPLGAPHVQRIELGQGTIQPVNFFASGDASLLYIPVLGRSSVLVYNFETRGVSGIELQGNATPLGASMTADASAILIAGSDGVLHQVNTGLGGADSFLVTFPDLTNQLNPFCTFVPTSGPCALNLVAVKP